MIILDDKLTLDALAGTLSADDSMATRWSFHYRLLQALNDPGRWGALSGSVTPEARRAVTQAPDGFRVLDPRVVTGEAAEVAVRHGLNLLAAELVTSGLHYGAEIYRSAPNVGRQWRDVMEQEGIELTVICGLIPKHPTVRILLPARSPRSAASCQGWRSGRLALG